MIGEPRLTDSLLRNGDVLLRYDHESERVIVGTSARQRKL